MNDTQRIDALKARYPNTITSSVVGPCETTLHISAAELVPICEYLRDESDLRYDLFVTLAATSDHILYQLASLNARHRVRMSIPQSTVVDSVAFVWPAANWAEREARERWHIIFDGHPNPEPLLRTPILSPLLPGAGRERAPTLSLSRYPLALDGLCLDIDLEEEAITQATPRLGNRHAHIQYRLAHTTFALGPFIAARLDAFAPMSCDLAYALAAEQLLALSPPPRAQMLRVIYAELQRIGSHLYWLARWAQQLSEASFAAPAYAWQGRERVSKLFQWLGGNPIAPDAIAIGGLSYDAPQGWAQRVEQTLNDLEPLLDDLDHLLGHHVGARRRLDQTGIIDPGTALGLGVTGPNLRACGIEYDVRVAFPYAAYSALDLEVPTGAAGDAYARYKQRRAEAQVSIHLVRQALETLPEGPVNALVGETLVIPAGTAYASVESPRGEMGVLIVSTGQQHPQCVHIRAPSFANMSCLPFMLRGTPQDQISLVVDSLDLSISEAAR